MALNTISSDRLSTNVKNTNFTAAEKQDLTDDILPLAGQLGNRNLIINGTMEVSQRGTSAVVTSDGSNEGYNTVDRWQTIFAGSAGGALSTEQSSDAPDGFFKSVLLKCTTASTSLSGSEHVLFSQKLEGQNLSSLEWGKTSPKSVTFSWYMKAVNPKTLAAQLTTPVGSGRYFLKKFTPTTSWARYSFTIPGDSVATTTANAEGLALRFGLSIGSSMQQAADSTAWSSAAKHGVSGQGNFLDSTSNQLFITGVQLEVGSVVTDFEHRSYAQELALCQRYYYQYYEGSEDGYYFYQYVSSNRMMDIQHPVPMRADPTPTITYNTGTPTPYHSSELNYKAYNGYSYSNTGVMHTEGAVKFSAEL